MTRLIRSTIRVSCLTAVLVSIPLTVSFDDMEATLNRACASSSCLGCVYEPTRICISPDGNCMDHKNVS